MMKYPPYPAIPKGVPGVMKSRGKAITPANNGIKTVALKRKNLSGIFVTIEKKMIMKSRMIKGIKVLTETAIKINAVNDTNFTLGSIPCRKPCMLEYLSMYIMSSKIFNKPLNKSRIPSYYFFSAFFKALPITKVAPKVNKTKTPPNIIFTITLPSNPGIS